MGSMRGKAVNMLQGKGSSPIFGIRVDLMTWDGRGCFYKKSGKGFLCRHHHWSVLYIFHICFYCVYCYVLILLRGFNRNINTGQKPSFFYLLILKDLDRRVLDVLYLYYILRGDLCRYLSGLKKTKPKRIYVYA